MPKIVRVGGLNLSDEVVRIRDLGPGPKGRPVVPPGPDEAEWDPSAEGPLLVGGAEDFYPEAEDFDASVPDGMVHGRDIQEDVLRSAMAEASRILEDAVKSAEEKKAEMLAEVQYEAEQLRQNAAVEGRHQGMAEVVDTVRQSAAALENAIAAFEGDRAGFESEYEQQLKWLAMEIASKVMAKKVADDDAEMTEMVEKAVQSVRGEAWIRVEVAQEMTHLIDRLTSLFDGEDSITVSAIPAEAGTVHVETPSGIVDASLRTQLANLRDYFAKAAQ